MKQTIILILSVLVLAVSVAAWDTYDFYAAGPTENTITLVFPPSTHFTSIVDTLAENKIISHPFLFKAIVFLDGGSSRIKAGEYDFPPHISPREVADMLESGKTVIHHLTVAEGLMTSEVLQMIRNNDLLSGEITLDVKEGDLLPETYNFSRGDKRNDIILRMQHGMQKALLEAWEGRAGDLPFATPEQALTLASIVEKETGLPSERQRVAAVYINRLKRGMLMQADPTTVYAVTRGKYKLNRPLTRKDLESNSPYNTYKVAGLPPGPIANPGKACIIATLHPLQTDELYFVATGTGGHNFARTPEEHAQNVKKYLENLRAHGGN